jgi:hypothetical protein
MTTMIRHRFFLAALVGIFLMGELGCSRLVKVKGVVKLDGVPVEGAGVVFAREGDQGRPAVGQTDSEGVFVLTTFRDGDGALRGEYKVTIIPPQEAAKVFWHEGMTFGEAMAEYAQQMKEISTHDPLPGSNIPVRFRDPSRTPLRQKVPGDGPVVFDLQSEPGEKKAPPKKKIRKNPFMQPL